MKHMNLITATALGIAALAFTTTGCDDTTETGGAGGASSSTGSKTTTTTTGSMTTTGSNMTSSSTGGNPPPPALGAQVDRFGRPAINTALNHPFDPMKASKDAAKDTWNGNGTLSNWVATFSAEVQGNLAVFDGVDTICGNQLAAGPTAVAGRYKGLGDILAMDRLWINTGATASTIYLAVEANALPAPIGVPNSDGGGRTLPMDVIDAEYTILATGKLDNSITDGISADADTQGTTFPFLAPPHM